jgi:site-specific DNA-methyltransferase (adenine-specific)
MNDNLKAAPYLTTSHGILFNSDCLEILKRIRNESVHLVFADPPFNLDKDYNNGFTDLQEEEAYLHWCRGWIDECSRILVRGGAFFLYILPRWGFHLAAHMDASLDFRHWIALSMKGTFPRGNRLYPAHYCLLYFTKGEPRVFNRVRIPIQTCRHCGGEIKDYGGHRSKMNPKGVNLTDFWDDTSPNRHRKSKARPGRAIRISTDPGEIVFDPFGGGGSTFQEAERLNRYWIGSEIGDCSIIADRLRDFTPMTMGLEPRHEVVGVFDAEFARCLA